MFAAAPGLPLLLLGAALFAAQHEGAQVVFAGGQRQIQTALHNSGGAAVEQHLVARVAILASSVAAPVAEIRRPESVKIGSGESTLITWLVDVPAVRAVTRFALTVSNGETSLGHWMFFALPPDLVAQMASVFGGKAFVQTGIDDLRNVLTGAGIKEASIDSPLPDMRFAILGPWKNAAPRQLRERVRALAERGATCIVLGGDPASLPRVTSHRVGKGAVIAVSGVSFAHFASNAPAQLVLWDACRMAAAPEELPAWIKD